MTVKFKVDGGFVDYLMEAGTNLVSARMSHAAALSFIQGKPLEKSDKEGYPIKVGKYYFKGSVVEPKIAVEKAPAEKKPAAKKKAKK